MSSINIHLLVHYQMPIRIIIIPFPIFFSPVIFLHCTCCIKIVPVTVNFTSGIIKLYSVNIKKCVIVTCYPAIRILRNSLSIFCKILVLRNLCICMGWHCTPHRKYHRHHKNYCLIFHFDLSPFYFPHNHP